MRAKKLAVLLGSAVLAALTAHADISESETLKYFGTLGQLNTDLKVKNPAPIGPNACVPTATINALTYLNNYAAANSQPSPFKVDPNSYQQLGLLATAMKTRNVMGTGYVYSYKGGKRTFTSPIPPAVLLLTNKKLTYVKTVKINLGGTAVNNTYNGLISYLSPKGANPAPTVEVSGQESKAAIPAGWFSKTGGALPEGVENTKPSVGYLGDKLQDNDGVEIGIEWGHYNSAGDFLQSGGGHFLTLDAITFKNKTDKGTISFLDPGGSSTSTDSAAPFTTSFKLDDGYIYFSYDNSVPDAIFGDQLGAGNKATGRIVVDMVESVKHQTSFSTPDTASTLLMLGGSIFGLAAFRGLARRPSVVA